MVSWNWKLSDTTYSFSDTVPSVSAGTRRFQGYSLVPIVYMQLIGTGAAGGIVRRHSLTLVNKDIAESADRADSLLCVYVD